MNSLTEKLRAGRDLNRDEVARALVKLLAPETAAQTKTEFLTALHDKGETAEEIAAFVEQLIDRAIDPLVRQEDVAGPMIDVCGTGGSGLDTFNVSTAIMFILAAGGACVVKHGNRSVTSCCGSADVLEALGIRLEWEPVAFEECVQRLGLGFLFARYYHPAFRALADLRTEFSSARKRTIFSLLGPLLNPARPPRQLIGVYAPRLTTVFAEVLRQLGRERAWIVYGQADTGEGMDDISTGGVTTLAELNEGRVSSAIIDTRWLGIPQSSLADQRGGTAAENAKTLVDILSGEIRGAKRDLAIANAAGGFVVAGLARDMRDGIALAAEQIDSGRALQKLRALQSYDAAVSQ